MLGLDAGLSLSELCNISVTVNVDGWNKAENANSSPPTISIKV